MPRFLLLTALFALALTAPGQVSPTDDVRRLIQQARLQLQSGQSPAAIESLQKALTISPNSPAANLALGDLFAEQHRYPEAMEYFETVLSMDRHAHQARQGELQAATALALQARRAGDQEAALACLRHAQESLPDDPILLRDLGIQLFEMRYLKLAAETLKAVLDLDDTDSSTVYSLARVETDLQQFSSAEQHFNAYLKQKPEDATAHYGLGHLLQMEQRADEAKAEFQRSIELQPLQTESYYQLGQIALDQGHSFDAKPMFERTLSRAPAHGGALTGLGILAYQAKDYTTASKWLKRATAASPEYQPAHYYLGLTLAREGDKDGSTSELRTAMDLTVKQQGKAAPVEPGKLP